ncbi:MAG: phosphate/phosphonate transporter substrate-binding protein, partial [Gemmatimonadetes bacterium]|nr:phosphate/phosphonate transporter substrate-binding protein [Gemmatimonadota bacterium]
MTSEVTPLPRVASLGMYDGGALTEANDLLWKAMAARATAFGLPDVPAAIERATPLEQLWTSERLLFGQTCGYPFASRLHPRVRLLGAPIYALPGCDGATHRSFIIVNASSNARGLAGLAGRTAVINEHDSMTGRHLLGDAVVEVGGTSGFFTSVRVSGSHANSLAMVALGEADVAAIDCVSYAHLARARPELVAATRIIHRSAPTPTLPFVISAACGEVAAFAMAGALAVAVLDPKLEDAHRLLGLVGLRRIRPIAYAG